jgi:uncharacterized membrane protein
MRSDNDCNSVDILVVCDRIATAAQILQSTIAPATIQPPMTAVRLTRRPAAEMRPNRIRFLTRALWCAAGFLLLLGLVAAFGRALQIPDSVTRAEPARRWLLVAFHVTDPFASERAAVLDRIDHRYADHPIMTLLHVLPGALLLILMPLQFSIRVRSRFITLHRWSGRLLVLTSFVAVPAGLFFGVVMPWGGAGEAIGVTLAGGFFLSAVSVAFFAIRRGEVARHREWMIRAFAVALGISTVRVVALVFDVTLTPAGVRTPEVFVLSIWTGWLLTLGVAEAWIRHTRHEIRPDGYEEGAFSQT